MKKKFISILLALVCILPCFTALSFAEESAEYVVSGEGFLPFEDIDEKHWGYNAAVFCYVNEIIKGQGNEYTFAPNETLTRATFVVMLARVLGADLEGREYKGVFKDCPEGTWYTASVEWAYEKGYVLGVGDGTGYGPTLTITREQGATMLWRVFFMNEDLYSLDILNEYVDKNDISGWAQNSVAWVINNKLMTSTSVNVFRFQPKAALSRAQSAVIFNNVISEVLNSNCDHEYAEADCTKGKTCSKCGVIFSLPMGHYCETLSCTEGGVCLTCGEEVAADAALHQYSAADCTTPEKCSVCGDVRKEALGHKFNAATCTSPKNCSVCGLKEGSALGHNYSKATCTVPATCSRCKATSGSALGHTTKFGICTRCNGEVFASKFLRCAYYMVKEAEPSGTGQYAMTTYYDYGDGQYDIGVLYYDATVTEFTFAYSYFWEDGSHISIAFYIPNKTNVFKYEIGAFDANENELSSISGSFNASQIRKDGAYYKEGTRSGSSQYWSWLSNNTEDMIISCVYYNDFLLDILCGEGVESFGFTSMNI